MSAPFRFGGFDDVRFEMLAKAAGYNAYEAWGRWCKAGSECTKRGTRVLSEAMASALFGNVDALLAAELGRRVESGIELDLEEGSIEWYGELKAKRQKAGQVRAQMPRDALGRLLPAQHVASTQPAHAGVLDQRAPAPSSAPDLSSDPSPAPEDPAPARKTKTLDPAATRLAERLADLIIANNPQHRIALGTETCRKDAVSAWAVDVEKLHRLDDVPHEQIEAVIEWSQSDEFWRANILSGKKLREKYDQLAAKMAADRRRPALRIVNRVEPKPAAEYTEQTL